MTVIPMLTGAARVSSNVELSNSLEIIAKDNPLDTRDRELLRQTATLVAGIEADLHRSQNYALSLEQHNAAQAARIKELVARVAGQETMILDLRQKLLPDRYGDVALAKAHKTLNDNPSWSMFPGYRLGGKVAKDGAL